MDTLQTIAVERRTYSNVGHHHDHPFAQLILPLRGTLFIETAVYQLDLDESSVFFIPPGCQHHFYARSANEFLTLDISPNIVSNLVSRETANGIRANFEERWRSLRTLLLAELDETRQPSHALLYLVQYMGALLIQPAKIRSLHYMHQHYSQPISITHLAHLEGYSLSYYSEWFKAHTGKSPKAYLQDLRLQQAKALLHHTDLPIYHIAQAVGFERASSLTRLFRQRDRTTPQQYRDTIRNVANRSLKFG